MLHENGGRIFRGGRAHDVRGSVLREPVRILIVDPVVGSRFALAKVIAQPGVLVETASSLDEARLRLARGGIALLLVEDDQGGERRGLEFLVELRERHPAVRRALVTSPEILPLSREDLERADLAFILSKPWDPIVLRDAIRDSLGGTLRFATWEHRVADVEEERRPPLRQERPAEDVERRLDLLVRGLLAGLNSCESLSEVFELLHGELALALDSRRWLWLDEDRGRVSRIVGDWPLETNLAIETLASDERDLVERARRSSRITRLDRRQVAAAPSTPSEACIGFALRDGGHRVVTALVWVAPERSASVLALLREIHSGLAPAVRRIRDAEGRALAARRLARRVSEELRTPVGAISHAIDRLRGEAERAGMSTEWVDRVSSESQRLARAVEQFEDEIEGDLSDRIVTIG